MTATVILGAGAVAAATAAKCAQHNDAFGALTVVARRQAPLENVCTAAHAQRKDATLPLDSEQLDVTDSAALAALLTRRGADMVINAASPYVNLAVMDACLAAGAHYLDTAVYEKEGALTVPPPPWYEAHEWQKRAAFESAGLSGVLSIGFDPGAVNVFCAHIRDTLLDEIDSIDIMDVNGGSHGRFFATNFDPETNLREIKEEVIYWHNGWQRIPPHSKSTEYDFPRVGRQRVFSMGHEELHSLPSFVPAARIEFWMGFSERYLRVFTVLDQLGLLSPQPVQVDGVPVVPLRLLKALLPPPQTLAADYSGEVCIGCLANGRKDGAARSVFVYSTLAHQAAYRDIGAQAISYTTAVPLTTAALLLRRGDWKSGGLRHPEQLPPQPFLQLLPQLGIDWAVESRDAYAPLPITRHDAATPPVQV